MVAMSRTCRPTSRNVEGSAVAAKLTRSAMVRTSAPNGRRTRSQPWSRGGRRRPILVSTALTRSRTRTVAPPAAATASTHRRTGQIARSVIPSPPRSPGRPVGLRGSLRERAQDGLPGPQGSLGDEVCLVEWVLVEQALDGVGVLRGHDDQGAGRGVVLPRARGEHRALLVQPGDELPVLRAQGGDVVRAGGVVHVLDGEDSHGLDPSAAAFRRATGSHTRDRKSTRLNSSHVAISYAVFCLKKKIIQEFDN